MDGKTGSDALAVTSLSRLPRLLAGCSVVIFSLSLVAACGGHGSSGGPVDTQSHRNESPGSGGGTATGGTYRRPTNGLSLATLPTGQGGGPGSHFQPPTVVTGNIAWIFKPDMSISRADYTKCLECAYDNRGFNLKRIDKTPLNANIRLTGTGFALVNASNLLPNKSGSFYCRKVECVFEISFSPRRPGNYSADLTVDGPNLHVRYEVLGEVPDVSAFPATPTTVPSSPAPSSPPATLSSPAPSSPPATPSSPAPSSPPATPSSPAPSSPPATPSP